MDNNNPYQAPQAKVEDIAEDGSQPRSKVPRIVGIVLLVLSIFGLLGMGMTFALLGSGDQALTEAMDIQSIGTGYFYLSLGIGTVTTLWAMYIAIQLIRYKDKGRRHLGYYMLFNVIFTPLSLVYQWLFTDAAGSGDFLIGLLASLAGLALYGFFWYLVNKDKSKASLT